MRKYVEQNVKTAADTYYQAPLRTKAAVVGIAAATVATLTQSDQCLEAWSTTLWTTTAILAAATYAPSVHNYFFPKQEPASSPKLASPAEQEMGTIAPPPSPVSPK